MFSVDAVVLCSETVAFTVSFTKIVLLSYDTAIERGPAGSVSPVHGKRYLPTALKLTRPVPAKASETSWLPAVARSDRSTVVITSDWSAVRSSVFTGLPSTMMVNAPTAPSGAFRSREKKRPERPDRGLGGAGVALRILRRSEVLERAVREVLVAPTQKQGMQRESRRRDLGVSAVSVEARLRSAGVPRDLVARALGERYERRVDLRGCRIVGRGQLERIGDDAEGVGVLRRPIEPLFHELDAASELGPRVAGRPERPHDERRVAKRARVEAEELGHVPLPGTVGRLLGNEPRRVLATMAGSTLATAAMSENSMRPKAVTERNGARSLGAEPGEAAARMFEGQEALVAGGDQRFGFQLDSGVI